MSVKIHNKMPLMLALIFLITWPGSILCFSSGQSEYVPDKELTAKLNEFRFLRENDHFIERPAEGI